MSSVSPLSSASQVEIVGESSFQTFMIQLNLMLDKVELSQRAKLADRVLSAYHASLRMIASSRAGSRVGSSEVSDASLGIVVRDDGAGVGVSKKERVSKVLDDSAKKSWKGKRVNYPKVPGQVPSALTERRLGVEVVPEEQGYCYLYAFKACYWSVVAKELGRSPSFFSLLAQDVGRYCDVGDERFRLLSTAVGLHLTESDEDIGSPFWGVMASLANRSRPAIVSTSVWHVLQGLPGCDIGLSPSEGVGASVAAEVLPFVKDFRNGLADPFGRDVVVLVPAEDGACDGELSKSGTAVLGCGEHELYVSGFAVVRVPDGGRVEFKGVVFGAEGSSVYVGFHGHLKFSLSAFAGGEAAIVLITSDDFPRVEKWYRKLLNPESTDSKFCAYTGAPVLLKGKRQCSDRRVVFDSGYVESDDGCIEMRKEFLERSSVGVKTAYGSNLDYHTYGISRFDFGSEKGQVVVAGVARLLSSESAISVKGVVDLEPLVGSGDGLLIDLKKCADEYCMGGDGPSESEFSDAW